MKKNILPLLFIFSTSFMLAQVGIGTKHPDQSAMLDIQSNKEFKGVLIPRISLTSLTDNSMFTNGHTANSLLVFNTTENKELKTGYYYWFESSWVRLLTDQDNNGRDFPKNEEFAVDIAEQTLYLKDSAQNVVSVALADINLVTTLEDNRNGTYRYTAEDGTQTTIDVVADVINNIAEIVQDTQVVTTILEQIESNGKPLTGDGIIAVSHGEKSVLAPVQLSVNTQSITPEKIKPGSQGSLLITNATGEVEWMDATDEVIKEILATNQAITLIKDRGNGTFVYYNESCFDAEGNFITSSTGVTFDANTLTIKETQDGTYAFYDQSSSTPLAVIDIQGTIIEHITDILSETTVKEEIYQSIAAQGKALENMDGTLTIEGGEQAVLANAKINIKDQGVSVNKIKPGSQGSLLITNATGEVEWMDATDEVIKEILTANQAITLIKDLGNGTFVYYNESCFDAEGNFIASSTGVTFDANTLTIKETQDGTYAFYDQSSSTPLAVIDIQGTIIEHITDILSDTTVKEEIYQSIAAQGKALENMDGTLTIEGGEQAVLANAKINIKDQGVSVNKIKPGSQGSLLITNATGEVEWMDATDEVIKEILTANQAITLIKDRGNGTFVYYNESCFDAEGNFIASSTGVTFDANTLTIKETEPGIFIFSDKKETLHILDTRASHILVDDSLLGTGHTNVQEVLETLTERIAVVDNQTGTLYGTGILINNGQSLEKAVLQDVNLSLAQASVGTEHLQVEAVQTAQLKDGAVVESKLWAGTGKNSFVPVAQSDGSVKYEALSTVLEGKSLSTDNSIVVQGDASSALLQAVKLEVAPNGIASKHLKSKAVTESKIGAEKAEKGAVLTANGVGGAVFMPLGEAITQVVQGDIVGDEEQSILVVGGENVLVGNSTKTVNLAIAKGGVKSKHLADQSVSASKLTGGNAAVGTVAMVGEEGQVSYQPLTSDALKDKGKINTDGIIVVSDEGVDKVLKDVTLSIANQSIPATKLTAGTAVVGAVATVGTAGQVSYQPLTPALFEEKGNITTDGIIIASDQGVDKVLSDVHLKIKEKSIRSQQLADQSVSTEILEDLAVTHEKITSGTVGSGRVLLSAANGGTQWGELDQIYDKVAGNLTTDDIIAILPNAQGEEVTGTRALLKDLTLGIKNQSITNKQLANQSIQIEKLNSEGADAGMVMVTTADGGFTYVSRESIKQKGEDLMLGDGLEFLWGNGQSAVLAKTEIGIKNQGITTAKLQDHAVTTSKISSEGAINNAVLTANGQGAVDYKVLNENVFSDAGADLLSDGSIKVVEGNQALLKAATLAIAQEGVDTKHLKDQAVTTQKISSIVEEKAVEEGAILMADGDGKTTFTSLEEAVSKKGKSITSDTSIAIQGGEKAVLQSVSFQVAPSGIQNKHLGNQVVTIDKMSTKGESEGLILVTDGEGGALYQTVNQTIGDSGKTLQAGDAIAIVNGEHATLKDVTISLMDQGVTNAKLADQTITPSKLDAEDSPEGTILTAMGDREARFVSMKTYGKRLDSDSSLVVSSQEGVLLAPASIRVSEAGIENKHLGANAVTIDKMSSVIAGESQQAKQVLLADGQGGFTFGKTEEILSKGNIAQGGTISAVSGGVGAVLQDVNLEVNLLSIEAKHLKDMTVSTTKLVDNAVTTEKISNDAVGFTQLKRNAVYGTVIKNEAITTEKIAAKNVTVEKLSSANEKDGVILMADGHGGVIYKELKASMPKFFYLPSIYLDVTPGLSGSRNIYDDYAKQFGQPKYASPNAGTHAKLPVLPATELNFYITYVDESIFEEVKISNEGVLSYKVREDAVVTYQSYMNIVLEVRE